VPTLGTVLTGLGGSAAAPAAPAMTTPAADDSKGAAAPALKEPVCSVIAGGRAPGGAEASAACICTAGAAADVAVTAAEVPADAVVTKVQAEAAIANDEPVRFRPAGAGAMAAPAGADAGMAAVGMCTEGVADTGAGTGCIGVGRGRCPAPLDGAIPPLGEDTAGSVCVCAGTVGKELCCADATGAGVLGPGGLSA
jgi:hypothetical protein